MRALGAFVETPLAAAIGWTLLHSLWEGALVAAGLGIVLMTTKSPRVRYAAACVAMCLILAASILTLIRMAPFGPISLESARIARVPASEGILRGIPRVWAPDIIAFTPWLAPCWLLGVIVAFSRQLRGLLSVYRLRERGVCSVPPFWRDELARLSSLLRLSRSVSVLESCLAEAPVVLGHFRPLILLPVGLLAGMPASQIETIFLHELAHVRRLDYLVNVCQRLVEGLLFYHPAIWWITRIIRAEREHCCDDLVVSVTKNAHEYAVALTALEYKRCSTQRAAIAATGGNIVNRISRLLYPSAPNRFGMPLLASLFLLITVGIVTLTAWQSVAPEPHFPGVSPYTKWLNEDVAYIIQEAERSQFLKLATDDERQHFIEQFWLRRDPTPGTPRNEFKEEHYRRIVFTNEHFGTGYGKPGWRTDRGRIYVIYGPPDEIDSHPAGGILSGQTVTYPFENWRYSYIQSIGNGVSLDFADPIQSGELRMTVDPNTPGGQYRR